MLQRRPFVNAADDGVSQLFDRIDMTFGIDDADIDSDP
jgi:hypothetical protein